MKLRTAVIGLVVVAVVFGACAEPACAGKLKSLDSKLSGGKSSGSKIKLGKGGSGELILLELFIHFCIDVLPYLLFPQEYFEYSSYPYQYDRDYLFWHSHQDRNPNPVSFEFRAGYHADLDGVHGFRAYSKARLSCYFNVDFDVFHHLELDSTTGDEMSLTFYKLDGLFNIVNTSVADLDLGFGFSYVDGTSLYGGANVKFTADIFPVRPLALHFAWSANVFANAVLFETETGLGIFFKNLEIRAGYRYMWIDEVEVHGPLVEIAFWF